MKTFEQHVKDAHNGSKEAAADRMGVTIQVVYKWIRTGAVVIDGRIYRPSKYKV